MSKPKTDERVRRRIKLPPLGVALTADAAGPEPRSVKLTIRLTPTERRQMAELATAFHTTVTNVLIHLVAEARRALQKGEKA